MNNKTRLVPPSDEKKEAFLVQVASDYDSRENLFKMLYLVEDFIEGIDSSGFITELLVKWLADNQNDLNERRYDVRDLINHLAFGVRLKDEFFCFNNNSGFRKKCPLKYKKEVDGE